jgi:hypothetical protein
VERVRNSVRGGACHAIAQRGVGGGWGRQDLPLRGHRGQGRAGQGEHGRLRRHRLRRLHGRLRRHRLRRLHGRLRRHRLRRLHGRLRRRMDGRLRRRMDGACGKVCRSMHLLPARIAGPIVSNLSIHVFMRFPGHGLAGTAIALGYARQASPLF